MFRMRTLEQRVEALQEDLGRSHPEIDFSSTNPAMQRAVNLARQVAPPMPRSFFAGKAGQEKPSWPVPFTPGVTVPISPSASSPAHPSPRSCSKASFSAT